ncbi:MAG: hypothetical protein AB1813_19735 [Verrucomicrobiota bacterium]
MNKRTVQIGILLLLAAYVASYLLCRKIYETRDGEFITLYDEDSVIALGAHFIHAPLIVVDGAVTERRTEVGNWREPLPPEMIERVRTQKVD